MDPIDPHQNPDHVAILNELLAKNIAKLDNVSCPSLSSEAETSLLTQLLVTVNTLLKDLQIGPEEAQVFSKEIVAEGQGTLADHNLNIPNLWFTSIGMGTDKLWQTSRYNRSMMDLHTSELALISRVSTQLFKHHSPKHSKTQ